MDDHLLLRGAKLDAKRTEAVLNHFFETNLRLEERGLRGTPVCIWGTHGIGKTSLVADLAKRKGWHFAYCAPGQFEEMGDLHGLPVRMEADGERRAHTAFLPPEWVPQMPGPGILLLDDLNRADERILRGLMQLLQNHALFSWALPHQWQIVATANPEGGDYSVTPMDDAMLTRMMHVTMVFDAKAWAAWALSAGVDPRGIDFVLTYPELVAEGQATPRSLCQLFDTLRDIPDLAAELELVHVLARACLDDVSAATFIAFVRENLNDLIAPEEILDAAPFETIDQRLTGLARSATGTTQVARLATIATRLVLHMATQGYRPSKKHQDNVVRFLLHDALPNELRFSVHHDLANAANPKVRSIAQHKKLAAIVLQGM